jgi:hypothetical protein
VCLEALGGLNTAARAAALHVRDDIARRRREFERVLCEAVAIKHAFHHYSHLPPWYPRELLRRLSVIIVGEPMRVLGWTDVDNIDQARSAIFKLLGAVGDGCAVLVGVEACLHYGSSSGTSIREVALVRQAAGAPGGWRRILTIDLRWFNGVDCVRTLRVHPHDPVAWGPLAVRDAAFSETGVPGSLRTLAHALCLAAGRLFPPREQLPEAADSGLSLPLSGLSLPGLSPPAPHVSFSEVSSDDNPSSDSESYM